MTKNFAKILLRNVNNTINNGRRKIQRISRENNTGPRQYKGTGGYIPKCSITEHDILAQWNKQGGRDFIRGRVMDPNILFLKKTDVGYRSYHKRAPSVDRLDSTKDYTPDNIVITFRYDNIARGSDSIETYFSDLIFFNCLEYSDTSEEKCAA